MSNESDNTTDRLLTEQISKLTEDQKKTLLKIIESTFFESRQFDRKKYLANVDYHWAGRSASGYIQNISASGLHLKPSEAYEKGQKVTLTFQPPGKEHYVTVTGTISWRNQWGAGIKFAEIMKDLKAP